MVQGGKLAETRSVLVYFPAKSKC